MIKMEYSFVTLGKVERSLMAHIHPVVQLETVLLTTTFVRFRSNLPTRVTVDVEFRRNETVTVRLPYSASTLNTATIHLGKDDLLTTAFIKVKDVLCGITVFQQRLLKFDSKVWTRLFCHWKESPPYMGSVTVRVPTTTDLIETWQMFEVKGAQVSSVEHILRYNSLQWKCFLFNKQYGSEIVSRWEKFIERYLRAKGG